MSDEFVVAPIPTHKRFRDLSGMTFTRLMVHSYAGMLKQSVNGTAKFAHWNCICSCGKPCPKIQSSCLINENTKSCGCYKLEIHTKRLTKHGHRVKGRRSITLTSYRAMMSRCTDPNNEKFEHYGGRNIKVCNRWCGEGGFSRFVEDRGERPDVTYTLNRIDNEGDYTPENTEWATRRDQLRNKRTTRFVDYLGEKICITTLAENHGISVQRLYQRIVILGWSVEDAINLPKNTRRKKVLPHE